MTSISYSDWKFLLHRRSNQYYIPLYVLEVPRFEALVFGWNDIQILRRLMKRDVPTDRGSASFLKELTQ